MDGLLLGVVHICILQFGVSSTVYTLNNTLHTYSINSYNFKTDFRLFLGLNGLIDTCPALRFNSRTKKND